MTNPKPLTILHYPHPILEAVAAPVTDIAAAATLAHRMTATMREAAGVGLAAPQVGESLRLIIADNNQGGVYILINPEIVERDEDDIVSREEGCLSIPGVSAEIERPAMVVVEGLDENGKKQRIRATGLLSACLQHEIDHLNGVLFVDYLSALRRERLLKKSIKHTRSDSA